MDDISHNQIVEGLPTEHEEGEHEVIGSDRVQGDVELQSLPNFFVLYHTRRVCNVKHYGISETLPKISNTLHDKIMRSVWV